MRRLPVLSSLRVHAVDVLEQAFQKLPVPEHWQTEARRGLHTIKEATQSLFWPRRPQAINLEITSICDARCIHCPRHEMDRQQKPMEMSLFRKLVDEAAELEVPDLCPNGFGEILTMRTFDEHLAYIRSKSHRFRILINSNGFRMDDEKIDTLLRHEVDFLNVTLDGATAETFEAIRVRLKLDQIEDNIRRLIRARDARGLRFPKIRIGMVAIPQNSHEIPALLEKWRGVADFVGVGGYSNRAGSLDQGGLFAPSAPDPAATPAPVVRACVLPFRDMNIWADGRAVLCCDDWNEEHVVGDLKTQSLGEIWHGAILERARSLHRAGRGNQIAICERCNMWRDPAGARLWS